MAAGSLITGGTGIHTMWNSQPQFTVDDASRLIIGSAIGIDGINQALTYNTQTRRWRKAQLFTAFPVVEDDHGTAACYVLASDGPRPGLTVFASCGHDEDFKFRYTYYAGEIGGLSPVTVPASSGNTYSVFHQMGDTARSLYLFYRKIIGSDWDHRFLVSTDGGATWGSPVVFLQNATTTQRPYRIMVGERGVSRVDCVTTAGHPSEVSNNALYHFYFTTDAAGSRSWFKSDGSAIGSGDSALPLHMADITNIVGGDGVTNYFWVDLRWIAGVLNLLFIKWTPYNTATQTVQFYWRGQLVSGAWVLEQVCEAGLPNTKPHSISAASGALHVPPGGSLDPNDPDVLWLSRKYNVEPSTYDGRLEKWTRDGAGVWSSAENVGGTTGTQNMMPVAVQNKGEPTQLFYAVGTYTTFNDYNLDQYAYPSMVDAGPPVLKVKPTVPAWQPNHAPRGCNGYWPLADGSGTNVLDAFTTPHSGTFVGSPTWASGTYGPELTGFTSIANYVSLGTTQLTGLGVYPFGMAVLVKFTGTTAAYILAQAASGSTNPVVAILVNVVSGQACYFCRDNAGSGGISGGNFSTSGFSINDGNWHVIQVVTWSSTYHAIYVDGAEKATTTGSALGALTDNLLTMGALNRNGSISSPFVNGTIGAAATFSGGVPDPQALAEDWLYGVFSAVRQIRSNPLAGLISSKGG